MMMPLYYTTDPVTLADLNIAKEIWSMILDDSAPEYVRLRENDEGNQFPSCVMFFYDAFYHRLFDIHPVSALQSIF